MSTVQTGILLVMFAHWVFLTVPWHFDTQQNSNRRSSACSYGFMTLKNTGAQSLIYICAVWSSLRPPGRQQVLARLLYKQAASKAGHKYPLVHLTLTSRPQRLLRGQRRIHGGPVRLRLPWPWHVLLPCVSLGPWHRAPLFPPSLLVLSS